MTFDLNNNAHYKKCDMNSSALALVPPKIGHNIHFIGETFESLPTRN